jgi:sugar phosphate isomerase/epimerase
MKIGIYSITYMGVWYKGPAMTIEEFMRFAKAEGWEGVELDTKRPHASPMDLDPDRRKAIRDLSAELKLPISAVSPNCDLSSPIPEQREAMLCFVRECIKLTKDLGAPICKIFAAWRGVGIKNGIGNYEVAKVDPYPDFAPERWRLVAAGLKELAKVAGDAGVTLALQNHEPVIRNYKDVLAFIREVNHPALKACMDIPIEGKNSDNPEWARQMVKDTGALQVHSHFGGEWKRGADGKVVLGWDRQIAYADYVKALVQSGYQGFMNWEYCHPAMTDWETRKPGSADGPVAGMDHVHGQTRLALEFMKGIRSAAGG